MRVGFVLTGCALALAPALASADNSATAQGSVTIGQPVSPQPAAQPAPAYAQQPPPGYAQPGYAQPGYAQPGYGQPGYAQPAYGAYPYRYRRRPVEYNGGPLPPGAVVEERVHSGLIAGGAVLFGVPYLFSLFAALGSDAITCDRSSGCNHDLQWLYMPVVGPFITAASPSASATGTAVLIIDGLAQAGGVAMFIAGLVVKKRYVVMQDSLGFRPRSRATEWALLPGAPGATAGLSLSLTHF